MRLLKLFRVTAILLVLAGCSMVSGCEKEDKTDKVNATEVNAILVGKWHLLREGGIDMSSKENYITFSEDGSLIYEIEEDGEKTTLKRLYHIDDNWVWSRKEKTYSGTITDFARSSDQPISCTISGNKLTTVDSSVESVYKKI
ncbi:MAG: hypothetical protein J5498_03045 [Bacteroidales bacterium]|nr:hypothetical protein [Bacteroidales bacterium]